MYKRIVFDPINRQLVQLARQKSDSQGDSDILPAPHTAELNLDDLWYQAMNQIRRSLSREGELGRSREEFIGIVETAAHRISRSKIDRIIFMMCLRSDAFTVQFKRASGDGIL